MPGHKGSYRLFLAFFIPMVLAAVGSILLVPTLVDSGSNLQWGSFAGLVVIAVGCMFVVRRIRPDRIDAG